ncbi:penicillin-binding protein 2 [Thermodesulfobacterium hydrogeniphilum]|uniref:penicillin-binding protein 2 n=1 Tax=Thermodesulfobacterium hydrogeniphilum TaxID=161156 RepID=UPI00068FFF46|nr:penicillin-binding protein 2 [Thermodesulfobacterium hydrogeniphilum]
MKKDKDIEKFLIRDFKEAKQKILKAYFWENRIAWAKALILVIFLILWGRIFYLQIIRHGYYYKKAKERSIVTYVVKAPRGQIITSDGVIVATNKAVFQLYVDVNVIKNKEDEILYKLSKLLGEDLGNLKEKYYLEKKKCWGRVLLKKDLRWDEIAKIMVRLYYLPGVIVEVESERYYPYKDIYFHLIGYVSRITKKEYLRLKDKGYSIEDFIGKRGIEKAYESYLKGKNGFIEIERDAYGRLGRIVARHKPIPGKDLILTINHKLQMEAYKLLKGKRGAIVALSPENGAILAMVSSPSLNPQKFVEGFNPKEWKRVILSKKKPFLNRALSAYPPGSTYKVVTALAALQNGIIKDISQTYFCPGFFKYGKRIFRCWKFKGHGNVNLIKAISESCDVYFYNIATKLDIDYLAKFSRKLGLGEKVLNWPEEKEGLVPDREWKIKNKKEPWYPGDTINTSIGQGDLLVTPIQLVRLYMVIANGGYLYKAYLVKAIKDLRGKTIKFNPVIERKININPRYLSWIRRGLIEAVKSGTGKEAFIPELLVAGKTGTAQVTSKNSRLEYHAWFVSYAGRDKPEIVTVVFIEHGGHGGSSAAPIAREIYKAYFNINEFSDSINGFQKKDQ